MNNELLYTQGPAEVAPEMIPTAISQVWDDVKSASDHIAQLTRDAILNQEKAQAIELKATKWYHFTFQNEEALKAIVESTKDLSKGQIELSECLQSTLRCQQKMAQAISFLFGLSIMSLANSEKIIRELELRLKNASKFQINELARQEVKRVLEQLRAQRNMQVRLEEQRGKILEMDKTISGLESKSESLNKRDEENLQIINSVRSECVAMSSNLSETINSTNEQSSILADKIKETNEAHLKSISELKSEEEEIRLDISSVKNELGCYQKKSIFTSNIVVVIIGILAIISIVLHFIG